jgi:hypothetical protein
MTVVWGYVSYGQLLIDWIGDIPDDVTYFLRRTTGSWAIVTYTLVAGHFAIPFLALLNRRLKRRTTFLAVAGAWLVVMHYLDVYWQVLPVYDASGVRPHWLDLAALLFVGGLSCAWSIRGYAATPPLPLHVPELAEGLDYEAAV